MASSDIQQTRAHYRSLRQNLSSSEQQHNAASLADHLCKTSYLNDADHIACYLSNDAEIATQGIIETAWSRDKHVYLPVLSPLENSLYFAPYAADSEMKKNRFGIAEPACSPDDWIKAEQLDVVLLPLVAFDASGNRLGMGGGYYDRTLAFIRQRERRQKPFLIGLAHELQRADRLSTSSWDIPLDAIATETDFIRC